MNEIRLQRTGDDDPIFRALIVELDRELAIRDGDDHTFYAPFNEISRLGLLGVVIAFSGDEPVGCGAFKRHEVRTAEIKRMFVDGHHRGQRIGASVLAELETWAVEQGFDRAVLETGLNQPEAIALYTRSGYERMPNYGQYSDMLKSVCMRKVIDPQKSTPL